MIADNVCIESLSIDITKPNLDAGARSISQLANRIEQYVGVVVLGSCRQQVVGFFYNSKKKKCYMSFRITQTDARKLQEEYTRLVEGLQICYIYFSCFLRVLSEKLCKI